MQRVRRGARHRAPGDRPAVARGAGVGAAGPRHLRHRPPGAEAPLRLQTSLRRAGRGLPPRQARAHADRGGRGDAARCEPGDGAPAPRYHFMRRVHSRDGEPYCVISIYLDERVFRRRAGALPPRDRDPGAARPAAREDRAGAARRWRSARADVEVAGHLGMPVNSPVAEVRRVCRDARRHRDLPGRGDLSRRLHAPRDGPQALTVFRTSSPSGWRHSTISTMGPCRPRPWPCSRRCGYR